MRGSQRGGGLRAMNGGVDNRISVGCWNVFGERDESFIVT